MLVAGKAKRWEVGGLLLSETRWDEDSNSLISCSTEKLARDSRVVCKNPEAGLGSDRDR